jgi:NADH-quinone oxidoreductase subunit M
MLKLGAFGFIRYLLGLFYDICLEYSLLVCSFAAVSIFYSSVSSITETDAKRLIAQTSIAHMGLVVLGLFMFSEAGFFGALYLIVGHGITSTALFYLVGILYDRFHTRELRVFGGLVTIMPLFCTSLFFFTAANSGFP